MLSEGCLEDVALRGAQRAHGARAVALEAESQAVDFADLFGERALSRTDITDAEGNTPLILCAKSNHIEAHL